MCFALQGATLPNRDLKHVRCVPQEATVLGAGDQLAVLYALRELPQVQQEPPHRRPVCHALQGVMPLSLDHLAARYVHLAATHLAVDQEAVLYALREPPQVQWVPPHRPPVYRVLIISTPSSELHPVSIDPVPVPKGRMPLGPAAVLHVPWARLLVLLGQPHHPHACRALREASPLSLDQ